MHIWTVSLCTVFNGTCLYMYTYTHDINIHFVDCVCVFSVCAAREFEEEAAPECKSHITVFSFPLCSFMSEVVMATTNNTPERR